MALKKSMINKLEKHKNYFIVWLSVFLKDEIEKKIKLFRYYSICNPKQPYDYLYLIHENLISEIIPIVNQYENNDDIHHFDIYQIITNKYKTHKELVTIINSGINIKDLSIGESIIQHGVKFKRIEIDDL